ncbi:MAG: PrsW family intramembrane metalloprotease [Treponema sp.]|jgi:hypothetical protein|nr:PrsW family intramembrane metalloprotease [Treponema sp.]
MNIYAALVLCFIPFVTAFILAKILVPQLKIRYELWGTLIALLSVIPIVFIQFTLHDLPFFNSRTYLSLLLTAVIFNGLIEEMAKMIFMLLLPSKRQQLSAFFATAVICGFAFGSFESVIYFLKELQKITATGTSLLYNQIFLRMFTSVIIHAVCAGFSGLYIWSYRIHQPHISPFLWAAVLHGLYNFFSFFTSDIKWFSIAALLFALTECRLWYKRIAETDINVLDKKVNKH